MIRKISEIRPFRRSVTCSIARRALLMSRCVAALKIPKPALKHGAFDMRYAARVVDASVNLRPTSAGHRPVGGMPKRLFDIMAAAAAIALLSPLFAMLALLVKLSDQGPVFYAHRRIGRNGNIFHCLKFRTMVMNGDEVLARHFVENPKAREEWLATRKLQDDPRVTRVGQVLRKLSL